LAPVELDALAVASALCLVDFGFHIAVVRAGRRTAGTGTHWYLLITTTDWWSRI
jgi:hypothetical protein